MFGNRKNQSAAIRFGTLVRVFLACALIAGSGLGYVWQKNQVYNLGQVRLKKEAQLRTLKEQNEKLRRQFAEAVSPAVLGDKARELKLGLAPAQPGQILRLIEPAVENRTAVRQLAASRPPNVAAP